MGAFLEDSNTLIGHTCAHDITQSLPTHKAHPRYADQL